MSDTPDPTGLTRRNWLAAAGTLPLAAACVNAPPGSALDAPAPVGGPDFPALHDYPNLNTTYLDSGSTHPFSVGARAAVNQYLARRSESGPAQPRVDQEKIVTDAFAKLINASPEELAFIQSTSAGEQMAVRALGIPEGGG